MKRGFTLIELTIYIALVGMIFLALTSLVTVGNNATQNRTATDDLYYSGQRALTLMQEDIWASSAISAPSEGSSGSTLELTVGGDSVVYSISSGELLRTEAGSPESILLGGVEALALQVRSIANTSAPVVISIDLDLQHPVEIDVRDRFTTSISTYYE